MIRSKLGTETVQQRSCARCSDPIPGSPVTPAVRARPGRRPAGSGDRRRSDPPPTRDKARGTVVSSSGPANRGHEQATSRRAPARGPGRPIPPRTIIWHSALEFLLTFVLLFGVVTFVRWVIGPSAISHAIPQIHLQLLIVGTAVGLLVAGLILSPPGRASGGRMNPAISLAMWRLGVFLPPACCPTRRPSWPAQQSGRWPPGRPGAARPPGLRRHTPRSSQLQAGGRPAVRHRGSQHVRHRADHWALPERAPACGRGPLDSRPPRRRRYRGARHIFRGQRQPRPAIRPRPQLRPDPVPVGLPARPHARSRACRTRTAGDPPGPPGHDSPTMPTYRRAPRPGATRAPYIPDVSGIRRRPRFGRAGYPAAPAEQTVPPPTVSLRWDCVRSLLPLRTAQQRHAALPPAPLPPCPLRPLASQLSRHGGHGGRISDRSAQAGASRVPGPALTRPAAALRFTW